MKLRVAIAIVKSLLDAELESLPPRPQAASIVRLVAATIPIMAVRRIEVVMMSFSGCARGC